MSLLVLSVVWPVQAMPGEQPDACLEVAAATVTGEAWRQVAQEITTVVAERSALFPSPTVELVSHEALLGAATASVGVNIDAGHAGPETPQTTSTCLEPGLDWTARFGQAFLQAGADLMLAEAPTTPGINSSVDIGWHADEERLRTTLVFAGPFDIPNGTCWIDDALSLDEASGLVRASAEQGIETSLFAEGACGRFFDHLPDGGAGEQAVTLFPAAVQLDDGTTLLFVATQLWVTEDAVVIGGSIETR